MTEEKFFVDARISKLFFKIALPGAIGMLFSAIYPIIDGIFVSQYLGEGAFAALNLVFPFVYILFCISDLIGVGSSVLIAISLGKKENEVANRLFTTSIIMIIVLETILAIIAYFIAPYLVKMLNATGTLYADGLIYLRSYIIFIPLSSLVFAVDNYLRICGKVKTSMFLNIFMSLLIIAIEYLFLGILRLDIYGSSLACSISFILCAFLGLNPFIRKKLTIKFSKPKITFKELSLIIKNGGPTFINNIAGRLMGIIFNVILINMAGENAVNAYGVLMSLEAFVLPLMYGTCDALQPATGYNYGAGHYDRVKKIQKLAFTASLVICLVSFVLMLTLNKQFTNLYVSLDNKDGQTMTNIAITIYAFTYLTRWFSYSSQSFFAALSRPIESSVISLSISFAVPLILVGCFYGLGLFGVWLNFPISSLIVGLIALILLLIQGRRIFYGK